MQEWGQCKNIQDAISLDMEPRRLTLWILDRGNAKCSPKILSYSLIYNDVLESIVLKNVPRRGLNTLEVVQRSMDHETRAYIGNAGNHKVHCEKAIRYKTNLFCRREYNHCSFTEKLALVEIGFSRNEPFWAFNKS